MIYPTAESWRAAPQKRVLFFGMSGLGKTHIASLLRSAGDWFHYSVDYRIGTRYMGEYIADNAKREAMKVPFLRALLMSDSIYIGSNITFENLGAVSSYLGKPGSAAAGGLSMNAYAARQEQFRRAEIAALLDTPYFIERARALYDYPHFICDTGGSICEWADPDNPQDEILKTLSANTLMIWLKGSPAHTQELIRRFDKAPKPMAYQPAFLARVWSDYLNENNCKEGDVDPDSFIRYTYAKALAHRQPRYEAMARWGVTIEASNLANLRDERDFDEVVAAAITARNTAS
ncbi:ATPase [uncultured Lentibacter sp.]|uniref:ATPase n=1 Tax=uncultured Lentibacter sp. TaxID=1659309 RepID=UPI0026223B6C|nr:ATPase [uncultured Lentibacter sp.]